MEYVEYLSLGETKHQKPDLHYTSWKTNFKIWGILRW